MWASMPWIKHKSIVRENGKNGNLTSRLTFISSYRHIIIIIVFVCFARPNLLICCCSAFNKTTNLQAHSAQHTAHNTQHWHCMHDDDDDDDDEGGKIVNDSMRAKRPNNRIHHVWQYSYGLVHKHIHTQWMSHTNILCIHKYTKIHHISMPLRAFSTNGATKRLITESLAFRVSSTWQHHHLHLTHHRWQ